MAEHVDRFVQELTPSARAIGAEYGIDPALIITQAAIESGWGKQVAGNNYFGVKSHGQPGGQTILTHEEVGGKLVPTHDSFRKYGSLEESMRDYAKFLSDNPRYSGVFEAKNDLQGQIDAIAKSGYATSSNYPNLLNSVSRMVTRAMPQDGTVAMGYAPTPAARGQNPALSGIQGALLPPLGPPGSGAPLMRPAAKKPNFLQMAMQGIRGGVGGFAQQAQPTVMRAAQRAAPTIMQAALGTVAGRTALIEPGLKNIMTGSPAGSRNTQVVQSYRDQGNSPSQSYAAANSAAVERAIAGAANPEQARRLNSR